MALVPLGFVQPATFADLAPGAVFRFAALSPYQIAIKVEAARRGDAWILVLGGGSVGPYPSPWYGMMQDVIGQPLLRAPPGLRVEPTGPRRDQAAGERVLPGSLIVRKPGRFGVFIEDGLAIDLLTGRRFATDARQAQAYDQWAMRSGEGAQAYRLFQYPIPEGVRL